MFHAVYWTILRVSRSNPVPRHVIDVAALWYYRLFRKGRTFRFRGRTYPYFYHPYNRTVAGERIVEIPIAKRLLDSYPPSEVLEIGNVLPHYFLAGHTVLDKYEHGPGVINDDVATFRFRKKFSLIFSVSTMEHVGHNYGEEPDDGKFLRGIENLKRHLKPGGVLMITCPVFYNPVITRLIRTGSMPFPERYFMERVSYMNDWKEVRFGKIPERHAYDSHFANANHLFIGFYTKPARQS